MIKVGITERHGISDEYANHPPSGFEYSFVQPKNKLINKLITSSAMGVYDYFEDPSIDIFEAPLFPILTKQNWIYTPAEFSGTANFGLCGLPLPKSMRLAAIEHHLTKKNFKKLVFKSHAGFNTLKSYGGKFGSKLIDKACVVYPAMALRDNDLSRFSNQPKKLMFSGDFFRKGGANVVDAFIELSHSFPDLYLRLCCAEHLHTQNVSLREEYLKKIISHPHIELGKVSREEMLSSVLPETDIFLSPTYQETFGFAILEAMSFGIPTVTSNVFAIPEIVDTDVDGIMLDIKDQAFIRNFKGYTVDNIPDEFNKLVTSKLLYELEELMTNKAKRQLLSVNSIEKVKRKFSPQIRAQKMKQIYSSF